MNVIETIAPIGMEDLKKYFADNTTYYVIDYKNSSLRGNRLLTYLSNLDIPCDVKLETMEEAYELFEEYLTSSMLVNVPSLEYLAIEVLMCYKGLVPECDIHNEFIEAHRDTLESWTTKLDSLTLYNMYSVGSDQFKDFVKSHPEDDTADLSGINFLSLLKHEEFYLFYSKVDQKNLKYYSKYFNDYIFKGKNLYSYWATEKNTLFLLTWGIATNNFDIELHKAGLEEYKELTK